MRKFGAKEHIIDTIKSLIKKNGYGNINIKNVAKTANVSVGTLYYHFPRGKLDILITIFKQFAEDFMEDAVKLGYIEDNKFSSINEAIEFLLSILVKQHKKIRLTLAAWESEVLANLDYYIKLRENMNSIEEIQSEIKPLINYINNVIRQFPKEGLSIDGKETQFHFLTEALIHKYAYGSDVFKNDEDFIKMMSKIVLTILKDG